MPCYNAYMKYAAFLRGINVGGVRISKAELIDCCQKLGYKNVTTVANSGNVAFEAADTTIPRLQTALEQALGKRFHYDAKVIVISQPDLGAMVKGYSFDRTNTVNHHYLVFIPDGYGKQLVETAAGLDLSGENVQLRHGVIYWEVPKGSSLTSAFAKHMNKQTYVQYSTVRNINTVEKLLAKFVA